VGCISFVTGRNDNEKWAICALYLDLPPFALLKPRNGKQTPRHVPDKDGGPDA